MSYWKAKLTFEAQEDLNNLDKIVWDRVVKKILWLKNSFDQIIPLPLGGGWRGFFKLRVGDWRVIYEIVESEMLIIVHRVDHRDKVYKR